MRTQVTSVHIENDNNQIPKGMIVRTATFDGDTFVSSEEIGLTVLHASEIKTYTDLIAALGVEKAALQNQVTTLTSQKATLTNQVASLQSQLTDLPNLQNQLAEALALVEEYRPFPTRVLTGKAFYKRITQVDMETLLASDIPQLVIAGKTILAYRDNDWPVMLDSTDFQTLVQGVLLSGVFDAADVTAIMRDATKDEAYVTP